MKKSPASILILAPAVILLARPAFADRDGHDRHGDGSRFEHREPGHWREGHWRHGWHDGRIGWWWVTGGLWSFYPAPVYPFPDPYGPPVVVEQAPPTVMIQQPPQGAVPPPAQNWYYCAPSRAYYPYVSTCPVEWQLVPAAPQGAPQ
jgi:hypothetical protein